MSHSGSSPRPVALAWLERAGDRRYVESETRIGRGEQNNFQLNDPSISRDHALIRRVEGDYVLSDLDSSNGSFVNDDRVYEPRRLARGDRVRLANVEFTFNIDQPVLDTTLEHLERPIATSISQFLTISGQIEPQNYLEGDLRVVTVLFLDLCGFTALSERMSPEQITLVVNQCFQHLTETATHFGGFVDKYIGDAMMVLFGAPRAHADDAERGVRAAIGMQERLATFSRRLKQRSGIELQMRVGINTGEVLAGAVGSGQFSAFTVMGDTVNLASRLEEHARVGHILVSESTYQLTSRAVRYSASTPTSIRGKQDLVRAYEVEGLAPEAELGVAPGFVGRQQERAQIEELLAERGTSRVLTVRGPVGSGKSRLIEELHHAHVDDVEFVVFKCSDFAEHGAGRASRSLIQQLQQRSIAHEDLPTLPDTRVDDSPLSIDGAALTIGSLLRALAQNRSVVVVVDRLDLADAATTTLLEGIASTIATCDVLRLALTRGEANESRVLELPPLEHAECEALLDTLLSGEAIEPTTRAALVGWSRGWPGLMVDIVRSALDTNQLHVVDGRFRMASSIDVGKALALRTKVQAELDQLTLEDRHVLRLCAVVGDLPASGLLANASGIDPNDVLDRLTKRGYLQELPSGFAMSDEVTRRVIEASLTQVERRHLHEEVARALQDTYDPGQPDPDRLKQLAHHFAAAGQHWQAVEYLLRSADLTAAAGSMEAAVDYYRALLKGAAAVGDPRERARLTLEIQDRIGEALLWSGSLAEAQIAFELAAENSASDQRRAELQIKLGVTGLRRGNPRRVLQIGRAILNLADVASETRACAEALMSLALSAHGSVSEAREHAERSIALAVGAATPASLGLARLAAGRAYLLGGDLSESKLELESSVATREAAGDQAGASESRLQLGLVQDMLGELHEAEESVGSALTYKGRTATPMASTSGPQPNLSRWRDRWTLASAAAVLGRIRLDRGDTIRARRHLLSALQTAEAIAARELALEARLELGAVETMRPNVVEDAVSELRSVIDAALALELRPLACRARIVLGATLCGRGAANAREAAVVARDALVQARALDLKLHAASARRVLATALAELGYWPQSEREFELALTDLERIGARVELVRTLDAFSEAEYLYAPSPRVPAVRARRARATQLAQTIGLPRGPVFAVGA
jgi:class 3 adenylate cyclase/predicted ATPase